MNELYSYIRTVKIECPLGRGKLELFSCSDDTQLECYSLLQDEFWRGPYIFNYVRKYNTWMIVSNYTNTELDPCSIEKLHMARAEMVKREHKLRNETIMWNVHRFMLIYEIFLPDIIGHIMQMFISTYPLSFLLCE